MQCPPLFVQNCTQPDRFNHFGLGAIMPAEAMEYPSFALQNGRVGNTVDLITKLEANNARPQFFYDARQIGAVGERRLGADLALPPADEGAPLAHSRSGDSHQQFPRGWGRTSNGLAA